MATVIMMKNPQTGVIKKGFYGFSWTTFWFGGIPAFFRGDIITGAIVIVLSIVTFGFAGILWAVFYNKYYTTKLIERGYKFMGSEYEIQKACLKLGISQDAASSNSFHSQNLGPNGTSGNQDFSESLEKLASLRDKGIVTEAEFQAQKAKILK